MTLRQKTVETVVDKLPKCLSGNNNKDDENSFLYDEDTVSGSISDDETLPENDDREYKQCFRQDSSLSEQETIMKNLPDDLKKDFKQISFARWGKTWFPVIQLGPFDVADGPVRKTWLNMYEAFLNDGKPMRRLVMWYGNTYQDRNEAYGFVAQSNIVSFECGKSRGYDKIPQKILKKQKHNRKLGSEDKFFIRALEQMKNDLTQPPSRRIIWMSSTFSKLINGKICTEVKEVNKSKVLQKTQDTNNNKISDRKRKSDQSETKNSKKGKTYRMTDWEANYRELCGFKQKYGHCDVPLSYPVVTRKVWLGDFVRNQRVLYKKSQEGEGGEISQIKIELLEAEGFTWKIPDRIIWEDFYDRLLFFSNKMGHCDVPHHYPEDKELAKWVVKQRNEFQLYQASKKSILRPEYVHMLDEIGFDWQKKGSLSLSRKT